MTEPSTPSIALAQFLAFLEAVALGGALAACYDIYRALHPRRPRRRLSVVLLIIADCLFWVLAAFACLAVMIRFRWGEVYFYTYLGLAGGGAGYFYLLSRFLLPFWNKLFALAGRVWRTCSRFWTGFGAACSAPFRTESEQKAGAAGKTANSFAGRILGRFRRR